MSELQAIALSRGQIKDADRIGGIELMLRWPATLGVPPAMWVDEWREASLDERAEAHLLIGEACKLAGLVPVHTRVRYIQRPGRDPAYYLAVTIIGARWVHASSRRTPRRAFVEGLE